MPRPASQVCYGVLAGGFLSDSWLGKEDPDLHAAQENRSLTKYALVIAEFGGWGRFQRLLRTLRTIADRHSGPAAAGAGDAGGGSSGGDGDGDGDVTVSIVATAWVLSRPAVGAAIIGARNSRHLDSTAVAARLELSATDMREIQDVLDGDGDGGGDGDGESPIEGQVSDAGGDGSGDGGGDGGPSAAGGEVYGFERTPKHGGIMR